jgi:hypothetical protein
MEMSHPIGVASLDTEHRRDRRRESLRDGAKAYEGLTDEQVTASDREVKTRVKLTRHRP